MIYLLSAPRCGSSCVAGCLSLCGLDIGKSPTERTDEWNQKGYFENREILEFNQRIMKSRGISISNPMILCNIDIHQDEFNNLIKNEFANTDQAFIKDPRIISLWGLYRYVKNVKMVVLKRKRKSCIESMKNFPGFKKMEEPGKLYDKYYHIIDLLKTRVPHVDISFEKVLKNPVEELSKIEGIEVNPAVCEFVEKALVHH